MKSEKFQSYARFLPFSVRKSLRYRLLYLSLIIGLIPTLITGVFAFTLTSRIINNMAVDSSVELVERMGIELDSILSDTSYLLDLVQKSLRLQDTLKMKFDSIEERYSMDLTGSTELYFISEYKKHIFGLYIIGQNHGVYKSNNMSFLKKDLRYENWYGKILMSRDSVYLKPSESSRAVSTGTGILSRFIGFGTPFVDKSTGRSLGVILIEIEEELIKKIINSTLGKTGYVVILDKNNNPVVDMGLKDASDLDFSQMKLADVNSTTTSHFVLKNQKKIIIYRNLSIPEWKIVGVIPHRELMTDRDNAILLIIVILISCCFLAALFSYWFSEGIATPVQDITKLMEKVKRGDLSVKAEVTTEDEIGELAVGFNDMIENIDQLMSEIYKEQLKLRQTELRLLQAQINPHFLYNTLDSIRYLSKQAKNDEAVKMVTALAKFFRSSLSHGKSVVTLGDEIKRIENYLIIQMMRYSEQFTFEFDVPDDLKNYLLLKLLLQPLVENAIYHGIKEKPGMGLIRISVKSFKDELFIEVYDTGCGMGQEALEALKARINKSSEQDSTSYGLHNVQDRIRIFFGNQYNLDFRSELNEWFSVIIRIPAVREEKAIVKSNSGR